MTDYERIATERLSLPKEGTNEPNLGKDTDPAFGVICGVLFGLVVWAWALFFLWRLFE